MELRWDTRLGRLAALMLALFLLLVVGGTEPDVAAAQGLDPAATVSAYAAALNTHDLAAGLALFDAYGSATDELGRHFEGRAGLTAFLLGSGFGDPGASVTTDHLRVLGNRAVWTYTCSCADGPTEVRLVLNQDKISVFFMTNLASASGTGAQSAIGAAQDSETRRLAVELAVGLALAGVVIGIALRTRRHPVPISPSRPTQGSMLTTLALAVRDSRRERR